MERFDPLFPLEKEIKIQLIFCFSKASLNHITIVIHIFYLNFDESFQKQINPPNTQTIEVEQNLGKK